MPAAVVGAALAVSVFVSSAAASGATRLRSGSPHARLVSHVTPRGNEPTVLSGSDVMAAVVGCLAVLALAYLIVTYTRRRLSRA